jgi:hypothetical protein
MIYGVRIRTDNLHVNCSNITEDTMRSKRTIAIAVLSAANIRSFARPSDWLCTHVMGSGYSLQTNTKPEQGLPRPD